ncbi:fasciclin domain-containing protein [Flaviaesturariibacter flavus]|uniref:Fasciclin domain-containing protein n=1 Tax=Flaviaesturariibacter flavus TaxID=2502780 RepID=A0A4R1B249_9BACT|nr:fasciclin domain-containing protein [Flaviaesturariibacter flavus]TCJ12122.1 fasciclin domain-containing protein [Flaviaesturariibacter flavus]
MKKVFFSFCTGLLLLSMPACNNAVQQAPKVADAAATANAGQSGVQDDESQKDVVKVAAGSKDHSTLVAAVKAGALVDALSNAGPFTLFAPTNAAFEKLPAGTVDELLKPENKTKLQDLLQYHVYVGSLKTDLMQDGQTLNQVNGGNISISKKDGKVIINGNATIIASIPASNGIIHVIDAVLLPPAK